MHLSCDALCTLTDELVSCGVGESTLSPGVSKPVPETSEGAVLVSPAGNSAAYPSSNNSRTDSEVVRWQAAI